MYIANACYRIPMMRNIDRYRGCLIGGAVGDALGYPIEFLRYNEIIKRYGKNGLSEYVLDNGIARISDDTQMTLFTATGLLLGAERARIRGISGSPSSYVRYSYKDWYRTQTENFPLKELRYSWLSEKEEMFSRRAPGNTCLSALASGKEGTIENPINDSKGCGGVMRVSPVALFFGENDNIHDFHLDEIDHIAAEVAAITHGHPLGYIPGAALVHIITLLLRNATLSYAVSDMLYSIRKQFADPKHNAYADEFSKIIMKAIVLAKEKKLEDIDAIRTLGGGWVGEEALAIALYSVLRYPDDFEKALTVATNHDGDSDSTGAIAGNILGTYLGLSGIPGKYLENLELKDLIIEIADDLFKGGERNTNYEEDQDWLMKYWHCRRPGTEEW